MSIEFLPHHLHEGHVTLMLDSSYFAFMRPLVLRETPVTGELASRPRSTPILSELSGSKTIVTIS